MANRGQGLYYEEFKIGDKFFSGTHTVTEGEIMDFAEISGDFNPIHTDKGFAQNSIYGERIAHGLLGISLVSGLASELGFAEGTTVAFRGLEWKFNNPIKIGDSFSAVFEVIEKRTLPIDGAGLVVFRVIVSNQEFPKLQSGKWSIVILERIK
jgi:3-hydroxybutyryl-CoA dehydratase